MAGKLHVWNTETKESIGDWLDKHFSKLDKIVQAVNDTVTNEEYDRMKGSVALDGIGGGIVQLPVPLGFSWILQRITVTSTDNGRCVIYENTQNASDTLEIISGSQLYSDAFSNNVFVPGGSSVLLVFTNAGINGTATYNLQIKLIKQRSHTHAPKAMHLGDA